MAETELPVTKLVVDSQSLPFERATLHLAELRLSTGLLGSDHWSIDIAPAGGPPLAHDLRVEVVADGTSYSGAAQLDGASDGVSRLVGNGPLISYDRAP
jgi:hypothetical protein